MTQESFICVSVIIKESWRNFQSFTKRGDSMKKSANEKKRKVPRCEDFLISPVFSFSFRGN